MEVDRLSMAFLSHHSTYIPKDSRTTGESHFRLEKCPDGELAWPTAYFAPKRHASLSLYGLERCRISSQCTYQAHRHDSLVKINVRRRLARAIVTARIAIVVARAKLV